jgi:hypothetical protein
MIVITISIWGIHSMNFYSTVLDVFADIWYDFIIKPVFANPRECEELKELITDIARDESMKCLALLRQQNEMLQKELNRIQRERIDMIHEHAAEIKRIHSDLLILTPT